MGVGHCAAQIEGEGITRPIAMGFYACKKCYIIWWRPTMRLHADASLTLTWPSPRGFPLPPSSLPFPRFCSHSPGAFSAQARGRPWHRCSFCTPGRGSAPPPPFLPQGSFKRAKKGYEEIHVPAPKSTPVVTGELMPITDLPEWARQGFTGLKTHNFV